MYQANPVPHILPIESSNPSQHCTPSYTLYIGDSMIKQFDCDKLLSATQRAEVFAFPGAKVCDLLLKIRNDDKFKNLDPTKVNKIYILIGANDVDKILQIPFSLNSDLLDTNSCFHSKHVLENTKDQLTHLADFIHNWFP